MNGLQLKYFVLNPDSSDIEFAIASRKAMLIFADEIDSINPELATDLKKWVKVLDDRDTKYSIPF